MTAGLLLDDVKDYYFEDFKLGQTFHTSAFVATEENIISFAKDYDPQYFHLDAERARNSIFGGLVCGGFQTAALAWGLALKTRMFEKCAVAGIGVDKLRWLKPVREGDSIHAEFQLIEGGPTNSRPGIARATFEYRMINQDKDTVMTLQLIQLVRCRPAS